MGWDVWQTAVLFTILAVIIILTKTPWNILLVLDDCFRYWTEKTQLSCTWVHQWCTVVFVNFYLKHMRIMKMYFLSSVIPPVFHLELFFPNNSTNILFLIYHFPNVTSNRQFLFWIFSLDMMNFWSAVGQYIN